MTSSRDQLNISVESQNLSTMIGGTTEYWPCNGSFTDDSSEEDTDDELPPHLKFNGNALTVVIVYCVLFVIAAVGNLTVFVTLFRGRHRKSRISLMMLHLTTADLMVTFIMIPLEVGWRLTTQWVAGNLACKLFLFLRAFGLYLSSNVLVCVSMDRYFAILHPLSVNVARRRGKIMLTIAWIVSLACSAPQSLVFHVSQHPEYKDFHQCVTFGFFTSRFQEIAYNLFCVVAMYFIPLIVICFAYTCIMCEISKNSNESRDTTVQEERQSGGRMRLRRSDMTNIERARSRTLRMTITIVAAFIWCWTPYVVMTLWYMFDRESAQQVDTRLQDALFIMAVSNSCMNPLVYGSYAINCRRECGKCFSCVLGTSHKNIGVVGVVGLDPKMVFITRVRKMAFAFLKVGSAATRSTATFGNGGVGGGLHLRLGVDRGGPTYKTTSRKPRQISINKLSASESSGHAMFHSEPSPRPHWDVNQELRLSLSLDMLRRSKRDPRVL